MRERPSSYGARVGAAIAEIASSVTGTLPSGCCATCAFRPGCMTNQMAATTLIAFKCAVGADPSPFGCHHGMKDGEPQKPCAGWLASQVADFDTVKEIAGRLAEDLKAIPTGPDVVREKFDAWIAKVDPAGAMNDYERGRLYLKAFPVATTPRAAITPTPATDTAEVAFSAEREGSREAKSPLHAEAETAGGEQ